MTKSDEKCEICEKIDKGEIYEVDSCYTSIGVFKRGNSGFICATGDDDVEFEIYYCPMCGKKLDQ